MKSIPKKDSSQRITILQYFVFCKNLLDTNPPPRIFRSIVSEMIRGKYLLLAYSFFGKAFRLRVPIWNILNFKHFIHFKLIDWFLYGESFLLKGISEKALLLLFWLWGDILCCLVFSDKYFYLFLFLVNMLSLKLSF